MVFSMLTEAAFSLPHIVGITVRLTFVSWFVKHEDHEEMDRRNTTIP